LTRKVSASAGMDRSDGFGLYVPVLDDQSWNLIVITPIACHQYAIHRQYNCSDAQILRANPQFLTKPIPQSSRLLE